MDTSYVVDIVYMSVPEGTMNYEILVYELVIKDNRNAYLD